MGLRKSNSAAIIHEMCILLPLGREWGSFMYNIQRARLFWVSKPAAQCTASPTVYNPGFESSTFLYLPAIGSGGRRRPRQSEAAHSAGHATSCQTETQQNLVTLAL